MSKLDPNDNVLLFYKFPAPAIHFKSYYVHLRQNKIIYRILYSVLSYLKNQIYN
jgi:hypothetical protein